MKYINNLSLEEKRTLLSQLLQKEASESYTVPLSFAQTRLWFLDQLEPGHSTYNASATYRLTGGLNIAALEQSLKAIVHRHEVLRTTFPSVNGQPSQAITTHRALILPIIDLQEHSETERVAIAQQIATEEAQQHFNLATDPLFRAKFLRLSDQEHILLLNFHHIIFDAWSFDIFFRELAALYTAFSNGQSSPLPELPIQYVDFAHWQRELLQGEVLESQLNYWKQQLGSSLPTLQLPTDYPRPSAQDYQGDKQTLKLSPSLREAIKILCQKEGVTLFMSLLATFQTLLHRYSEQEDIIVGTPIAGRNQVETEKLIGLFLNNLAIRTNLSGNPTFRQLLAQVRQVTLEAYEHQDLPFEKLVEELQPERSLSRHPIFDVMLNLNNTPQTAFKLPGLSITPFLELTEPESKFSMTLYVQEQDNQLNLELVYQKALFSAERMTSLLHQFQYLLEQIVAAPDKPIRFYSLVTPQSHSLLPNPNIPLLEPRYEPVTNLFTRWANQTPNQPAIRQGSNTWSYSQLSQSAQALAQILVTHGIKPGDVVAISGDRSFGLIASMLGILFSGGVLLTLEQNLPRQRKQLMLTTAQAKCLLYVGKQRSEDKWMGETLEIISVNPNNGKVNSQKPNVKNQPFSPISLSPDHAAYIFFTSGTTGIPKGVLGCHKGLSHFLNWQRQTFDIQQQDRIAQLTGLSFDVVLREIFLPLTSGATLCLPEPSDDLTPASIIPWLERQQISVLHTVPSLAQTWVTNLPSGVSLYTLRWIFFAGEPLPEKLVRQWRNCIPQSSQIVNLYGPTETTLAKCYYPIPSDIPPGVQPVGVPLPETQALVFKENNQLCGIGEPGEIVIRTPFRTLGYINTPQENQRRFVKNPCCDNEQDLLYYTGDRGRYRPDGSLEILGRLDHQVKIRGIRIELGEIETVLNQHSHVQETVVTVREDIHDEKCLVAYIVANPTQTLTQKELRRFLQQILPDYMMPSAFVFLDAFPLNPNGKIDRHALPAPERTRQELEETFVAPRDELELQLTKIWEAVLGIQGIGIEDNFFELGGHSLLTVRLLSQIEKAFHIELPLSAIFQSTTVGELAKVLRSQVQLSPLYSLVPIQPGGSRPPLFGIHWLKYKNLSRHLGPEQPIYGLYFGMGDPTGNVLSLPKIEELARHYIEEMRTIQENGPYFLMGLSSGGTIAYEMAQQLVEQGQQVALLTLFDTHLIKGTIKRFPLHRRLYNRWREIFDYLLRLGFDEFLERIKTRVKRKFHPDISRYFLHISMPKPLLSMREAYTPKLYSGRVLYFRAMNPYPGFSVDFSEVEWRKLLNGELDIHEVPGGHNSILEEPYVQILAEKMRACIDKALDDDRESYNPEPRKSAMEVEDAASFRSSGHESELAQPDILFN